MKTIYTTLPVYDQLNKQCFERSKGVGGDKDMKVPIITPRWRLPAMQWNVESDDPGELIGIDLINADTGAETDILDYFQWTDKYIYDYANDGAEGYDTLDDPGPPNQAAITDAQKTTPAGEALAGIILAEPIGLTSRKLYNYTRYAVRIDVTLTWVSGEFPKMELRDYATWNTVYSNTVTLENGRNVFFLTPTGNTGTQLSIVIYNSDGEQCQFSLIHNNVYGMYAFHPRLFINSDTGDEYFMYKDISATLQPVLKTFLDEGTYYLRFTSLNGYVYYSDYFTVSCLCENLIMSWQNVDYDPSAFASSGTEITIAGASGSARSAETFTVKIGDVIRVLVYFTYTSGMEPSIKLYDGIVRSNSPNLTEGLNDISLTATYSGEVYLLIQNAAVANYATGEVLVLRNYCEKFLRFKFSHSCNLGQLVYEDDFVQYLWLDAETMEPTFPYTEKGVENGDGKFIPTWQRQDKTYLIKTKLIPQFLVDVLHRLKLHDTITLTDSVGDEFTVDQIDVEHEWQFDDKYYALATLSVDIGEEIVTTACCESTQRICP